MDNDKILATEVAENAEQTAEEIAAEEQTIVFEKETAQEENNKFNNISSLFD